MTTGPVQVVDIEMRGNDYRPFWRIKTSDGNAYATTDQEIAHRAQQAHQAQRDVRIDHYGGWYYRDITGLELLP